MRVLITGGAGFIGAHVVAACLEAGHEVRVLDALLRAVHPNDGRPPGLADVDLLVGDVRDPRTVDRAMAGVDAVNQTQLTRTLCGRSSSASNSVAGPPPPCSSRTRSGPTR